MDSDGHMQEISGSQNAEAEEMGAREETRTWGIKHDDATLLRVQNSQILRATADKSDRNQGGKKADASPTGC